MINSILVLIFGLLIAFDSFQIKNLFYFEFSNLPQSIYLQLISILALVLFFGKALLKQKVELRFTAVYFGVFGFVGWAFLSLLWATNQSEGVIVGLNWLAGALLFFAIFNQLQQEADVKRLLFLNLIPVLFIIVVGLSQAMELPYFEFYTQIVAPSVTFGNKNMMVDAFVCLLPSVLLFSFLYPQKFFLSVLGYVLFGLGVILIVLSDTRAGMLAIALQIVLLVTFLIFTRKQVSWGAVRKPLLVSLPIVLVLFISFVTVRNEKIRSTGIGHEISFSQLTDRVTTIFKTKKDDQWALASGNVDDPLKTISDSRTMRLVTWKNTFRMFFDKPFTGFGLYNWQIHYGEYRAAVLNDPIYRPGAGMYQVHNDYLQILVDLGLIGFLLAASVVYFNIRSFMIVMKNGSEDARKMVMILALCLMGLSVVTMFSFPFERSVPVMMVCVYTAILAWFRYHLQPQEKQKPFVVNKVVAMGLGVVFLVGFAIQWTYQEKRLQAELEYKSANDQYALGNFELSVEHCKKTLELTSYRHMAELLLGYNYLNLNQNQLAEEYLLKGLRYYPNDLTSLQQLGTSYTKLIMATLAKTKEINPEIEGLLEKSEKWFNKALSIRSDFYTIYYNRGVLFSQRAYYTDKKAQPEKAQKYIEEALKNYLLAVKYRPDYIDGLVALARTYNDQQDYKNAIPFAERVANLLVNNFDKSEQELQRMETNKVPKTSRAFLEMTKNRRKNRQILIGLIDIPTQILKTYYGSVAVDLDKYLWVLGLEEKYYLAKEVEILEQLAYAQQIYEREKVVYAKDPKMLASVLLELDSRNKDAMRFKKEKQFAMLLLLINKAEALQLKKDYEKAVSVLQMASNLSKGMPDDADNNYIVMLVNMDKHARLNWADILCIQSTVNNEGKALDIAKFAKFEQQIESNLEFAQMSEKETLFKKFNEVYARYMELKKVYEQVTKQQPTK